MAIKIARAIGIAGLCLFSGGYALADGATATTNPPAYQSQGSTSLSQTMSGGLRVQLQSSGADINPGVPGTITPVASQQTLVLSGTAQSLTVPATAKYADFYPEGTAGTNNQCLRFRDDGTAPTASVGAGLAPQQLLLGYAGSLANIQFINATGATCTVTVNYYK